MSLDRLRDLPIRRKLAILGMATAGIALFVMSVLLVTIAFVSKREYAFTDLNVKADLVARNAAHALLFLDEKTAGQVLSELRIEHNIVYAAIRDAQGATFAEINCRNKILPAHFPAAGAHVFSGRYLLLTKPMVIDQETIGTLLLQKDMAALYWELAGEIGMVYATGLLAILIASLFFRHFQKTITDPIQALSLAMTRVTQAGDYRVRTGVNSRDELGQLGSGFNAMLETIAERDMELARNTSRLEETVFLRTEALEKTNLELRRQIAEREHAERQLQALNENLEQRIQNEVAANREKDHLLIQQSRHAAMGEMIGNIAHQWRQPLSVLGLILQNIAIDHQDHELTDDTLQRYVADALKSIRQMSSTIDDFRDFFRPNRLKESFKIGQAVSSSLDLMSASLKNNNIEVGVSGPDNIEIYGYPNEFAQVLLNLISNARDALVEHKPQHPRIEIETCADMEKRTLAITVKDNAGGVPDEIAEKIFDPYFTTKEKGTGIGLYMTLTIVEQHMGGRIFFRNQGEGAAFTIALPFDASQEKSQDIP
ncbi:MAG: ATP-binding protein [Sulfuricellaceae bacterium]